MYYIYIIQSDKNGTYYIGSSANPTSRLTEHNTGKKQPTKLLRLWNLVFSQQFENANVARKMEKKLKSFKSSKVLQQILLDDFIKTTVK